MLRQTEDGEERLKKRLEGVSAELQKQKVRIRRKRVEIGGTVNQGWREAQVKRSIRGNLFIGCECVSLAFVTVLSVFVRLTVRVEFSAA